MPAYSLTIVLLLVLAFVAIMSKYGVLVALLWFILLGVASSLQTNSKE